MAETPYTILGVTPDATAAAIKNAYFALVKEHPPERDPEGFRRIRAAYDALRTPDARADTDRQIVHPPPPYIPPRRLPPPDLTFHPEDLFFEARRHSDLNRTEFRDDFRPLPGMIKESV
ncbi:MAG TPA: DnaJ domain-containing protein [Aggregatilineales bacterium]|nr:DnaJ domain-containing protein [Anaerolineales bacterium]HRE48651.1 DnaJ domain-containing protein [Aggregatilineales bacterium]